MCRRRPFCCCSTIAPSTSTPGAVEHLSHPTAAGRAGAGRETILLTALLGHAPSLQALKQLILTRTEGNPFFIEELVQALVEQGVLRRESTIGDQVDGSPCPAPDGHTVAADGAGYPGGAHRSAAGGRQGPAANPGRHRQRVFLASAHAGGGPAGGGSAGRLGAPAQGEFIYEQPAFPEPEYTLKHHLSPGGGLPVAAAGAPSGAARAHGAGYRGALSRPAGRALQRTGASLQSQRQRFEKAVVYLRAAGQQASQRSALGEAIGHLTALSAPQYPAGHP